ncbi:MAG: aspartate kinase [Flavobacteriaceae bacterium]
MKVYKFGGASVKDAAGVRRLAEIVESEKSLIVVVSAMGKMTNAFERLLSKSNPQEQLLLIEQYHMNIISELFEEGEINEEVVQGFQLLFFELVERLEQFKEASYDFYYDQIVSFGERFSTFIIQSYLNAENLEYQLLDARKLIRTDSSHREANVDWKETAQKVLERIKEGERYVFQGFIAGNKEGLTTTLGREGSDYSAAILAQILHVESLSIWKDVPGVLNADPRYFSETNLLHEIPYGEAIEMAYYGASVIHPKTLKPLENKMIPLCVKSFLNPESPGTIIGDFDQMQPQVATYILKKNQSLIHISAKDFSFIVEHHIQEIFKKLSRYKLSVNLIQNSALKFSIAVSDSFRTIEDFAQDLQADFNVELVKNLDLYTLRNFEEKDLVELNHGKEIVLEHRNAQVYQIIVVN